MSVKIIMQGAFTTVQDRGRFAYQASGIGTNGVMDILSYEKANYLVGNTKDEAVLEATFFGGSMEFGEKTIFAVTGANMPLTLNEEPIESNVPHLANEGDVLSLGMATKGCRAYIAFAGGIDVPEVLGSRSTNIKCKKGGYEGRVIKSGDILPIGKSDIRFDEIANRKVEELIYSKEITLRVIEGPQDDCFTKKGFDTLYNTEYVISEKSDRMGYRLLGEPIETINGSDIVSDAIALGSIQVPANGEPIILLADRQTTGGYAKIACVITEDIPKIAQAVPGDKVRFKKIIPEGI